MIQVDATERQVSETLDGIRPDHRNRYEWAASRLAGKRVVDAACGVGYGSSILAERGCTVRAFDRNPEAIDWARTYYNHNPSIKYDTGDLYDQQFPHNFDAVVCFEALEHIAEPERALHRFRGMAPLLIASVPNEEVFPFRGYRHHVRHYTRAQFSELLIRNGWKPVEWFGQEDVTSEVQPNVNGRTLVVVAERVDGPEPIAEPKKSGLVTPEEILGGPVPKSVAIVAMGASRQQYFHEVIRHWSRRAAFEEVWGINAIGGLIQFDRLFHQDDIRVQEIRAEAGNTGVRAMLDWMKDCERPIYTSRAHPDYPSSVDFPLEWCINRCGGFAYLNSTVAAAMMMAVACRIPEIGVYGADFGYAGHAAKAERGRACVEFWCAVALMQGLQIKENPLTSLLDANVNPRERIYGYDTEWLTIEKQDNGRVTVARADRLPEDIPGAKEIELRYSHRPELERLAAHQPRG